MKTIKARDILHWNLSQIDALNTLDRFSIVFDDGEVEANGRATIFSWLHWGVARTYPLAPLLKRHHMGDTRLSENTQLNLLSHVLFDCYDVYAKFIDEAVAKMRAEGKSMEEVQDLNHFRRVLFLEDLARIGYEDTNKDFNYAVKNLGAYPSTLSILDVLEVMDHPEVKAANDSITTDRASITLAHEKIISVVGREGVLEGNAIGDSVKSAFVNTKQLTQCVSALGYRTDASNIVFRNPVLTSLADGLNKLHDFAIESRSATKSLTNNKNHLSDAEYLNRKLQLASATLRGVEFGDCGQTNYMPFMISDHSDLINVRGWFRYVPETKELLPIRVTDRHLIKTTVLVRTQLRCRWHRPYHICSTCMGEIANNIPLYTGIGHTSAVTIGGPLAQLMLSTKHYDGNAKLVDIILPQEDRAYLQANNAESSLRLASALKGKNFILSFSTKEAAGINSLEFSKDVRTLSAHSISKLTSIKLTISGKGNSSTSVSLPVKHDVRDTSLSYDVLDWIKNSDSTNYWIDSEGNTNVNLGQWDITKPILVLSRNMSNMVDFVRSFQTMVIGAKKSEKLGYNLKSLTMYDNPESALIGFYELLKQKTSVNLTHLANVILAFSIRSSNPIDYRLSSNKDDEFKIGKFSEIITKRSVSQLFAYQGARNELYNQRTYLIKHRPPSPMDDFIKP